MQKNNTTMWIWGIIIVIIVALGIWWYSASMSSNPTDIATSTSTTATTTGTGTGTTGTGTTVTQGVPTTNRSSDSVVAVAESIPGATTFASWLQSTGAAAKITGKGPYTIFVPTDGSVSQLPAGTFTNLSAAAKLRFVEYAIVSGKAIDAGAQNQIAGTIQALSGDSLNFSYGTNKIPMVNSSIVITEYKASNGIVYLIDSPLLPPKK